MTVQTDERANAILRCFETRDRDLLVRAFVTYVRTLMEYNSVVWSPDLKRDIDAIEKVQRRFTKRLAGLKKLSYSQRLKLVNLPSLELRRLHTDLLWRYKIVFGVIDLMCDDFFKLYPCTVTRGHVYKLYKPSSTSSARSHFFACRIINAWNNLRYIPLSTDFSSINAFKRSISKTDFSEFLKYDV